MTEPTFDPAATPPFPVYTLRVTPEGGTTLDGVPVEPAPGEDPLLAGRLAAARKAGNAGHDAVRVTAVTSDNQRFQLVIRANGDVYDITPEPPKPPKPKKTKVLIGAAAGLAALVLVGGGITAGVLIAGGNDEPVVAAPTPPPGAGSDIPVGLPNYFSPEATWRYSVAERSGAKKLADGTVLLLTPSRELAAIDPETGEVPWRASSGPQDLSTAFETTWQGRPVLASTTGQQLHLWPRDTDEAAVTRVDLEADATVTYAGTAPLIDLGDYTVLAPATEQRKAQRVSLPPGTKPVAVTENGIASLGESGVWLTDPESGDYERTGDLGSDDAEGLPHFATGIDSDHYLAQWRGEGNDGNYTALINAAGDVLAETRMRGNLADRDVPMTDADHQTSVVGDLFIDYRPESPALAVIEDFDVTALDGTTLYGMHERQPKAARVTGDGLQLTDYPVFSEEDTSPVLVTDEAAYVVSPQVDVTYLYRAPRTNTDEKEQP